MSMQDPVADMLTRIRNGQLAGKPKVHFRFSKLKKAISEVLLDEGYIRSYRIQEGVKPEIEVFLKNNIFEKGFRALSRISRPGLRIYRSWDKLPSIKNGLGVCIVSTSKGVMSDKKARSLQLGGEVICSVG